MEKDRIIREIRRVADANGGAPPGIKRFELETGIAVKEWYPYIWLKWSEALQEAGFEPNRMNSAYSREFLIEKLVVLTRELGQVPTNGHLARASRSDSTIPSKNAFQRLGLKAERVASVIAYCEATPGNDDVAALWQNIANGSTAVANGKAPASPTGYVYLLKHGSRREYKIGRTNNPMRREGEMGIQLPETLQPIHYIMTDDPAGVERYWHLRFAGKRKVGEWFALTSDDVRAFKRWKRIF